MTDEEQQDLPSAPEVGGSRQVPQLVKSTESTKPNPASSPTEPAKPEANSFWNENDDLGEEEGVEVGEHYDFSRDGTAKAPTDEAAGPTGTPAPQPKKKKRWTWPLIVLLVVALGAGAYILFGTNKKAAAPEKTAPNTSTSTASTSNTTPAPTTVTTKHYDSSTYSMGLDYPTDWKLSDTDALLSVTSPQMSFKLLDGTKASGFIFLTVQPKQTTLPDFAKGSAVAVLESEKLTYKQPTQNQRAQTYFTFASYASTTGTGWDASYVTGNNGYQLGQNIPMTDVIQTDPLVTVKFLSCTSQACTGTTKPLGLDPSEWKNTAISAPIKTIIQSFTFN